MSTSKTTTTARSWTTEAQLELPLKVAEVATRLTERSQSKRRRQKAHVVPPGIGDAVGDATADDKRDVKGSTLRVER